MTKLLIVESPTKARTIGKMLGKNYHILASMGHIRDLPERTLGVDIKNHFAPKYVDIARAKSIIKELKSAAQKADEIYLAPDPDREGEAIAWHLSELLNKSTESPFYRVTFHEITKSAIERALQEKGEVNLNLVDAQQARRVLDRLVGYQVSPLLWTKVGKGSSAGRVQSAALRLVVDRENEINAFKSEEYWVFSAGFKTDSSQEFSGELSKIDGKDFKIRTRDEADLLLQAVRNGASPRVKSVTFSSRKTGPKPPFTTSTLQQVANTSLHFSAANTMRFAQQLYEGMDIGGGGTVGLITYMRTDSVNIAQEAKQAAAEFIRQTYGQEYSPARFNAYKSKGGAQEAHEAIRPTDVRRTPEQMVPYLDSQQLKLYTLIWQRFVASQMTSAESKSTSVDVEVAGADGKSYIFHSTATVPVFPGFTKVYKEDEKADAKAQSASVLGALKKDLLLALQKLEKKQKFTEAPSRYTEATLIKALEENGIGRPSTYATIMRTILDRHYVNREKGKLVPSELGFTVNDFLVEQLPTLFDINFTAQMEKQLDEIEEGKIGWTQMLEDFYAKFEPWVEKAKTSDAPDHADAKFLLKLLEHVNFDAPSKVGRRTYDDGKFFHSLEEDFSKDTNLTGKQFSALLNMAAKYFNQIPPELLAELPPELRQAVESAVADHVERAEKREQAENICAAANYAELFAAFDKVNFQPPTKRGRVTYDDKKFFTSLKNQALSGKPLSEKQTAALHKLAVKYQGELIEPDKLFQLLGVGANPASEESDQEGAASAAEAVQEVVRLLEELGKVTQWSPPVKRGRSTFDDKEFYESLVKQFAAKKVLSPRQQSALVKLAARYGIK